MPLTFDELRVDAVWDIETQGWDRFVVGALWRKDGGTTVYRGEDDMAEALLHLPAGWNVWAHNGGKFDVLWLIDWMFRKKRVPDARVNLSGSSVSRLDITKGPTFRDSARLIPMSLKKACTMFTGTQKQELELPCECGKGCGGYCIIAPDMPAHLMTRLVEYLIADVESLRDTVDALITFASANGIILAGTMASSTWRTAKMLVGLDDAEWDYRAYKMARLGYFGGRVEVGRTRAALVYRYDRTQAYPSAMTKPLPVGAPRVLTGKKAGMALNYGAPGVYAVRVRVPESIAPPLPFRVGNRLAYPHGEFEGTWARKEIDRAVEVGAKVLSVSHAIAWPAEEAILAPYMERCFELREAATTDALKTWLKLLANSLSGAFAQDPENRIVVLGDYQHDPNYEQVGRHDWIWTRTSYRIPDRGHVHWAATLTADARVELHCQMEHAGEDWSYSDTDSCYATRELTRNVGRGLGVWKFEGEGRNYEAIAPKVYSFETDKGRYARAKGIPDAKARWEEIRNQERVEMDRGVNSFLTAVRGDKMFQRRATSRQLKTPTEWCGARIRTAGDRTRAPSVAELAGLPR